MTLSEFISQFDKKGNIVLLEGKRIVAKEDQQKLIALGEILCSETKYILFRSGNAEGSDLLFSEGVSKIDKKRLEVITPYSGHRRNENKAHKTHSLDKIDLTKDSNFLRQLQQKSRNSNIIKQYLSGAKNINSAKGAYLIRNTIKAIGTNDIPPANFGFFYDDLKKPMQGGTGYTMQICIENDIPIINQETWFKWI